MTRKWMKALGAFTLGLAMIATGCENVTESALTGPGNRDDVLLTWQTSSGYTIARETDPTVGVVTGIIDENGGVLSIGNHFLSVPAGAVSAPTTFVMTKIPGEIKVGLTATRLLPNDVGHAGFNVPVKLGLSYWGSEVPNESALKIVWVKADGSTVVQPTVVNAELKVVTGSLDHFSDYGLGWP